MTSVKWWEKAVFYELYIDKFAGNLEGLRRRLGYLAELGITCVHVLPFYPSPMADDGYDVSDYMGIRPELGTLEDFEDFIKDARARGMKVMIDFVLNHTSVEHPWFKEARPDKLSPKRDFYLWSQTGEELKGSTNVFSETKHGAWMRNREREDFYYSTFYPEQVDLNWENPEVFSEMMKVLNFWANLGVQLFRLDAVSHLIKKEGTDSKNLPETHDVVKRIRRYVDSRWGDVALVAEVHESVEKSAAYFGAGDECQLVYNFPLAEEFFLALIRNDEGRLWKTAEQSSKIPADCRWLGFLRNHDNLSLATLSLEDKEEILRVLDPEGVLKFGNGVSARLGTAFRGHPEKIKKAFLLLSWVCRAYPIRPVIYYGDEIGMENEAVSPNEKDTRRAVRGFFDWEKTERELKNPSPLFTGFAA